MTLKQTLLACLLASLVACKSKESQCNLVIDEHNLIAEIGNKIVGKTDPELLDKVAGELEDANKKLTATDVSDDGVKAARDGFAAVITRKVAFVRKLAGVLRDANSGDDKKIAAANKQTDGISKEGSEIAKAFEAAQTAIMTECKTTKK